MKLVLTEAALEDLRAIRAYTVETWGSAQEAAYLRRIWTRFRSIRDHPEIFRSREDLFPGCRIASEGCHVILFRVEGESLQVIRVLHSAMDFKKHL